MDGNKGTSVKREVVGESWRTKLCSGEGNHWAEPLVFDRFDFKFSIV